jgi:putative SOS response-associated peptidase YedK
MSTNNARTETMASAWTFRSAGALGQRCLIPADSYDEPYWGHEGRNIWWRFHRADGQPWALAGLWSEWTDPATGEVSARSADGRTCNITRHRYHRCSKRVIPAMSGA